MAIEMPIYYPASDKNKSVFFRGYLDIVMRDKRDDSFTIIDIKTSTKGWNKWQKNDVLKKRQLVLYKYFLAKQLGIDIEKIELNYFIVRRKVDPDSMYPLKRVQEFSFPDGRITVKKAVDSIDQFVTEAFNQDGTKNTDRTYKATAGEKGKNCKFCPHKDNESVCPKSNRVVE